MQVLIIEDEKILRVTLQDELEDHGYEVQAFEDPVDALGFFSQKPSPLVVSDIRLPRMNGLDLLSRIKALNPDTTVILMTAYAEVATAVEAMKRGAFDYLTKPFDMEELILVMARACDLRNLHRENRWLKETLAGSGAALIGDSDAISLLRNEVGIAANSDITVLLTGETGTGKDLTAQLIHKSGPRAKLPFVKISCAQYSRTVLESELFGHEQGAFTGASRRKKGKFALAHRGTVYLDDVDDLAPEIQVKLLRVLDEKVVEPVGALQEVPVDVRIIASTKKDLAKMISEKRFRDDLYYRLSALPVNLPPLRDRREDIALLIRRFWDALGCPEKALEREALEMLECHRWPGNVRELKNLANRLAVARRSNEVSVEDLPAEMKQERTEEPGMQAKSFDDIIASTEKSVLREALEAAGGNQSEAARSLGMKLSTFRGRVAKYGLARRVSDTQK